MFYATLNNLILRKNYNNFYNNGEEKMEYRLSNENEQKAIDIIKNEEINERLIVLKNQIAFINGMEKPSIEKTTLSAKEGEVIKQNLKHIEQGIDVLTFQKNTLETQLDNALNSFDIGNAVKIKEQIANIDVQLCEKQQQNNELLSKIETSNYDYDAQLISLRQVNVNNSIDNLNVEGNYSANVVADFKVEKAKIAVEEFLNSLPQSKKEQILNENEDLKGYVNVGENI